MWTPESDSASPGQGFRWHGPGGGGEIWGSHREPQSHGLERAEVRGAGLPPPPLFLRSSTVLAPACSALALDWIWETGGSGVSHPPGMPREHRFTLGGRRKGVMVG